MEPLTPMWWGLNTLKDPFSPAISICAQPTQP